MNKHALMAILAFCFGNTVQAAVIDLVPQAQAAQVTHAAPAQGGPVRNLAVTSRNEIVTPPRHMSELPEPEVFAMMLVGLILIGYRASRDSSDKFK